MCGLFDKFLYLGHLKKRYVNGFSVYFLKKLKNITNSLCDKLFKQVAIRTTTDLNLRRTMLCSKLEENVARVTGPSQSYVWITGARIKKKLNESTSLLCRNKTKCGVVQSKHRLTIWTFESGVWKLFETWSGFELTLASRLQKFITKWAEETCD